MHVVKWPNILQISCGVHTARFLEYVWPFYNIMHEKVNFSVSRRCHLLSLLPTMFGGITQMWINTKIQFCCSYNLKTYHSIYLWVISVSLLHFQSLLRFTKSQFGVTSSLLMKSSFLKIRF